MISLCSLVFACVLSLVDICLFVSEACCKHRNNLRACPCKAYFHVCVLYRFSFF